jgi:hypothetical protein
MDDKTERISKRKVFERFITMEMDGSPPYYVCSKN